MLLFLIIPLALVAGFIGIPPMVAAVICAFWQVLVAYHLTKNPTLLKVALGLFLVCSSYFLINPLIQNSAVTGAGTLENTISQLGTAQTWLIGAAVVVSVIYSTILGMYGPRKE